MRDHDGVEWLTVAQAAERFGLKETLLRKWISRGVLHGNDLKRVGRYVVVSSVGVMGAEYHLHTYGPKLAAGRRRVAV